jgi:hypothetical protein
VRWISLIIILFIIGCDAKPIDDKRGKSVYVKPSVDSRGRMRKGHVRNSVSTSKNAIKNQNRSKYYYQTRGKYRRKSKKD